MSNDNLELDVGSKTEKPENFEFEPIKGYAMLKWAGKRPFLSTHYYPAQLKEQHVQGESDNEWVNKIFWGDNLQVMSHLLREFRGKVDLIYIDPPYDSKADYKKKIKLKSNEASSDQTAFEEKQYTDMWSNDEFLQFMYERLIIMRELLSDKGSIYVHLDYRKVHHVKCLMDEIFGEDNFLNHVVWEFSTRSTTKTTWKRSHNDILFYAKNKGRHIFNWDDEMVMEELSQSTIDKYKFEDEIGKYRLNGRNLKGSPIKSAKDVDPKWEISNPEYVVRDYLREGKVPNDYFFIDIENQASKNRTDYPTQKPEELLYKLISASTNQNDIVFDCFMGSGTTQAVAMKLGRRFLGADINLGAIQTTTKRLLKVASELNESTKQAQLGDEQTQYYTDFEVYNVNHYDVFRNPIQAKELLIEALGIQPMSNSIYDGEEDGRMVKIMPVNHIATKEDAANLISGVDYKTFEKRKAEAPNKPVEKIKIYCMGHEPDLAAYIEQSIGYKLDVEVVDILRDKNHLEFKRDAEAKITAQDGKLVIEQFYPMNLMQKLSLMKENVEDWREMVESVMIDWNYDGAVFQPQVTDVPGKNELVEGSYVIPADAGTIRVKITDLLSESLEKNVE